MRLDIFLSQKYSFSRHQAQKLIKDGLVLVNGKIIVKPNFSVAEKDKIQIEEKKEKPIDIVPNFAINLDVIFEHKGFLIINKPAGILVHPVKSREAGIPITSGLFNRASPVFAKDVADTLVSALIARYPEIKSIGESSRPGIVHRLDQKVSGLMVIARNQDYYQYFLKIFSEHQIIKKYYALIHGQLKERCGDIKLGIGRTKRGKIIATQYAQKVKDYKAAITKYEVIKIFKKYSFVEIETLTGRTNQIRAHFKAIGHPLVGDELYGGRKAGLERIFLHAFYLNFVDLDSVAREFVSPLPEELDIFLNKLNSPC
ncbi:MAG: RluA family pseudouridine synthase [Patescibacteria group bacterium]